MDEKRAFREQKNRNERISKIHLIMKLPRELRARIYFLVMEDADSPRPLAILRAPTLALVSKQVQEEAMSVSLSGCTFYLSIQSNYEDIAMLDEKAVNGTLGPLWPKSPRFGCVEGAALQSGRCTPLSNRIRSRLQKMQGGSEDSFPPHVEMHITPTKCCGSRRRQGPIRVLSLRASRDQLLLHYETLKHIDFARGLDQLRRDAETVARDIATRHKKHKSFRYEELDVIAKEIRYWPSGPLEFR
ncbi:hypothetical protein F4859DRAFT_530071 [Xylaria cf. heliscus]|nr:hypothetical protein F4859DRAFT_530071 [Xylaria cf. heliscus]